MKKHAIVTHWLIDYLSYARGTLQGYFYNKAPRSYLDSKKTKTTPLILLSGLSLRWGFLKSLDDFLAKNGYPIYIVPGLKNNFKTVAQSAKMVWIFIEKNNLRNVIIIGHSKGGTIGKYLLLHHNRDNRIKGTIAIATPFKGSVLCSWILKHHAYQELTPDAALIQTMHKSKHHNHKIISIAPSWDNHIWPQNGSHLEGAENIKLAVLGHHRILFNKELREVLLYGIEKLARKQV